MNRLLFTLTFAFACSVAFSQERLTPELLWDIDRIGAPVLSPDGEWVAFTVTDYDIEANSGRTDIYVKPVEGGEAKILTKNASSSSFHPEWRPDGKYLGFLSSNAGSVQLFEVDPNNPDEVVQITNQEGGISGFHYAKAMNRIVFSADVKLDQTTQDLYPDLPKAQGRIYDDLMYRHWDSWHDYSYSHIFIQDYEPGKTKGQATDIMKGERFDSPMNPFDGSEDYSISPDGMKVAYTCKKLSGKEYSKSTNSDIYLYNVSSKKTENLSRNMMGYDKVPVFSHSGEKIAWSSMATPGYESDKNTIIVYDFEDKTKNNVLRKYDRSAGHLHWGEKDREIIFRSGINATYHLFSIDLKKEKIEQITEGRCNFSGYALGDKFMIAQRSTMSTPNALYKVNRKNGEYEKWLNWNDELLNKLEKSTLRKHWLKTTNGDKMLTWLILPPNFDSTKQYPTLLYCQGGPQAAISQYYSFRWNFELMAANDYIIVAPNRHGVPSFGQEYNHQISGDWGGQAMKDYFTAIDWASELEYVDENRLGAVGASYGGYSVYWLAGNHEDRFKCLISHCGLYNLDSWYATTEEMFFANYDLKGAPWDEKYAKTYKQFNPANFIKDWTAPILVIHGEKDFRVPVGEGIQAFNSAQLNDVESRFLYFPNEGHWVLSPQNGLLWHREFFRWLDEHLK